MLPESIQSDITIYNVHEDIDGTVVYLPTVISGVFWQGNYQSMLTKVGIVTKDKVKVIVPINRDDYLPSTDYLKLADKTGFWTITKEDLFINKATTEPVVKSSELELKHGFDNVLRVTSLEVNNFGSQALQHFVIIGG